MKQVNMIGGSLAAVLAIGVITACDGRGVTAMQSRRFSIEEQSIAKAMEGKSQSATPAKTIDATPKKNDAPAAEENEGREAVGQAQTKLFQEKGGVISASRSDILARAELQLGTPNADARALINGLSIWDKSQGGTWKINVEAVLVINGVEKNMYLSNIEVSSAQTDVVGGLSGVELQNRLASNVVDTVDSDKLVVSTVCKELKNETCAKAILIIQWNFKAGGSQFVLVEFDRAQNGKITGLTNVGELPSFEDANTKAEVLTNKPTATFEDPRRERIAPKAPVVSTKYDLGAISRGSRAANAQDKLEFRPATKPTVTAPAGPVAKPAATPASAVNSAASARYVPAYTPTKTEVKMQNISFAEYAARAKAERAARPVPLPAQKSLRYNHRNKAEVVPTAAVIDAKSQDVAAKTTPVSPSTSLLGSIARTIGIGL